MFVITPKTTVGLLAAAALVTSLAVSAAPAHAKGEPKATDCSKFKKGGAEWKKCTGGLRDDMTDQEIYYSGYWLARTGQYAEALQFLNQAKVQDARILTYIGFATRKLGDHDTAMGYYGRALAMNPNYTVARAYLGEAYLEKGDVSQAKAQLSEIATRCGTTCAEYCELQAEIVKHAAKS
jgi:tetratricopeptide (TPR) repeat protein